jgi:hypothetical protein
MERSNLKFLIYLLISSLSSLFWACDGGEKQQEHRNSETIDSGALTFITEKQSESLGCEAGRENCTYILIEYPHFKTGKYHKKFNEQIRQKLCRDLSNNKSDTCKIGREMEKFIAEYKAFKEEFPETQQHWFFHEKISVKRLTERVLCMAVEQESYLGGAHGNALTEYLNYNLEDGSQLQLTDILKEDYQKTLHKLLAKAFERELQKKFPNDSARQANLFEESPTPSENFALTDEGLLFHYNPYELGPYSAGSMELLISYQEASPILQDYLKE